MNENELTDEQIEAEMAKILGNAGAPEPERVAGYLNERKVLNALHEILSVAKETSADRRKYTQEEADLFMSGVAAVMVGLSLSVMAGMLY